MVSLISSTAVNNEREEHCNLNACGKLSQLQVNSEHCVE